MNSAHAIREAWNARAEAYAQAVQDTHGRGLAAAIELRAFLSHLPTGRSLRILDAGCGVGVHGAQLLTAGHAVTFADISPIMLERARAALDPTCAARATFLLADLRDLADLHADSFDAIISGGTVLSDCGDPVRALAELARVLRPQGVIGFSVRNLDGPQQKGNRQEVIRGGGAGFDWWFFSRESVAQLCAQAGLTAQRLYPVLIDPPVATDMEQAIRYHVNAMVYEQWKFSAWEMFVVATKVP